MLEVAHSAGFSQTWPTFVQLRLFRKMRARTACKLLILLGIASG